ncbi:MAG: hypothetical protein ACRDPC_10725 [Solirubrobacteraceae bacterium]
MSPLRILLVVLVIGGGVGGSVLLGSKAVRSLGAASPLTPPAASSPQQPDRHAKRHRSRRAARPHRPAPKVTTTPRARATPRDDEGPLGLSGLKLVLLAAIEIAAGALLVGGVLVALIVRRTRRRSRRKYALYELHLSTHDEAKPQDLEDMVESIANVIHAFPADRVRHGQPYVALELICGSGRDGTEWSINLRCEPSSVRALDAAISAAYPDVRLGRRHAEAPVPRPGALRVPGYVMRFRKERSFVYPLVASDEALASPPLEQIALAQVGLRAASLVRFQLTPTPSFFEELARKRYKRHENKLVRQERWGLSEGGMLSTLNRAEMSNAQRTQNRSLFWLEVVVAADSAQACKTLAAAVQARRGENRLHRRWMYVRQNLYRRRFPKALGPLVPSVRSLVSAAEVAHLLALPSARMKGVPVRRLTLPRIPAPPEAMRATEFATVPAPTTAAPAPAPLGQALT